MASGKLKYISMELLYCIVALVLGFSVGVRCNTSAKENHAAPMQKDWNAIYFSTAKQIKEDAKAYHFLVAVKNDTNNTFPLWMEWFRHDYVIHSKKDAFFLNGMDQDETIIENMNNYINQWK